MWGTVVRKESGVQQTVHDELCRCDLLFDQDIYNHDDRDYIQERHRRRNENPLCVCCMGEDEGNTNNQKHVKMRSLVCEKERVCEIP